MLLANLLNYIQCTDCKYHLAKMYEFVTPICDD